MKSIPSPAVPPGVLESLILSLADDELILGHRDSEWTGHGPILEEDIAFSNIAQDEIGHSLVWFTLYEELTGRGPDEMGFTRRAEDFRCCRFVEYPISDFAYSVIRQFLCDVAEEIRLRSFASSTYEPLARASERILKEEAYHRLHSQGLLERLGDATPESSRRMQSALDVAFPQALGLFEPLANEEYLVSAGIFPGNPGLSERWLGAVQAVLAGVSLNIPLKNVDGKLVAQCDPEFGGRIGQHTQHLYDLVNDLQMVFGTAPEAQW